MPQNSSIPGRPQILVTGSTVTGSQNAPEIPMSCGRLHIGQTGRFFMIEQVGFGSQPGDCRAAKPNHATPSSRPPRRPRVGGAVRAGRKRSGAFSLFRPRQLKLVSVSSRRPWLLIPSWLAAVRFLRRRSWETPPARASAGVRDRTTADAGWASRPAARSCSPLPTAAAIHRELPSNTPRADCLACRSLFRVPLPRPSRAARTSPSRFSPARVYRSPFGTQLHEAQAVSLADASTDCLPRPKKWSLDFRLMTS